METNFRSLYWNDLIFVINSLLLVDTTNLQEKMKWQKFDSCFNWNIDPVMLSQSAPSSHLLDTHIHYTQCQQSRIERALGIFINCSQGISHASQLHHVRRADAAAKWSWRPKFPPAELLQLKYRSTAIGGAIYRCRIVHTYRRPKVPAPAIDILRLAALQRRRLLILRVVEQQYIWLTLEVVV